MHLHCECAPCRFEDVQANKIEEIRKILDFLGIDYNASYVERQLSRDITTFKRYRGKLAS